MKSMNLHSWIGGAAVMLMLSVAASCTDEEMFQRPDTGNGIAFLPSIVTKNWSAGDSTQTRVAIPAENPSTCTPRRRTASPHPPRRTRHASPHAVP